MPTQPPDRPSNHPAARSPSERAASTAPASASKAPEPGRPSGHERGATPAPSPSTRARLRRRQGLFVSLALGVLVAGFGFRTWRHMNAPPHAESIDAAPPSATPREGLRGPRTVIGSVQDDRGQPLADAWVRLSSPEYAGELREVKTDASGSFTFADLPAAVLQLEITRDGHEGRVHSLQPRDEGKLTFVLARQGELHVALRDAPGNPVDDAEIVITGPGLWPAQAARADARGEALFQGLIAGAYRVRARRGARVAVAGELTEIVPGQRSEAELTLAAGASLTGVVLDVQTRQPLAGARVSVQDLTPGLDALSVRSDGQGAFAAGGLWPGAARVDVQCDGYAPATRELELPGAAPLQIFLEGAAALAGIVVDGDGKRIVGAQLSISTEDGLPIDLVGELRSGTGELGVTSGPVPVLPIAPSPEFALGTFATESDAAGKFRIARLAPQPLSLHVAKAGYVSERIEVDDLAPHAEKGDLRVVLRAAGRLVGKIADARGVGLGGVYVLAHAGDRELSALTNADGDYVLRDVLGELTVEAQPDGRTVLRCRAQVGAGEEARCDLRADSALHTLAVRVVDEYGAPLEGARVVARPALRKDGAASTRPERGQVSARSESGATRPDGTLTLNELPAPPYTLEVSLPGYIDIDALPVDGKEREVRVQLARAATLAGFVVDVLGRPVPGAFVSTQEGESSGDTDPQGAFTLTGVPIGLHSLLAHHATAGDGRSAEVRARASERLGGVRVALNGRYEASEADAGGARAREERPKPSDVALELRGRMLLVTQVAANGPASKAGLRAGDVLSAVDGEAPLSVAHARGLLRDPPGRSATVRVMRDRRPVNLRYHRPAL